METAKALIKETVPYMVDGTKTLSELLYGFADELYPGDIHDEPYEGAGYCVCNVCQIYVPAARAMEQTIERLTALAEETAQGIRNTGITAIFAEFHSPADAINQMALHIKKLTEERHRLRAVLTEEQIGIVYPSPQAAAGQMEPSL